jgi:siroheme synthase-like protein
MDATDRRLLDAVQAGVPLAARPFAALGRTLGLTGAEVVDRLAALAAGGVLRQIGPIFDTARLGYRSSLVAARVGPGRVDEAARVVGAHPGVSHSYARDHAWNLWFTLAVPPESALGLDGTAAHLARTAGLDAHRLLPALRVFKIGVRLAMAEDGEAAPGPSHERTPEADAGPARLSPEERAVVVALQDPLPLVAEPFTAAAARARLDVATLLDVAEGLRRRGVMRRFAAVLHHRRAGYPANAMGVWAVPPSRIAEVGARMAACPAVSHCYERPTFPDWPYSVFTMVHGRSRDECLATLDALAEATQIAEREALWSVRELKKVRLQYFTPEFGEWESRALAAGAGSADAAGLEHDPPGHPVLLRLAGRRVVVIGAGAVAERKLQALLDSRARVSVVSPLTSARVEAWAAAGAIELRRRSYRPGDLAGACLAYVATDDPAASRQAWGEAQERGVWINVADQPGLCDFFAPAVVRQGDLTIAVSTNGASPALARRVRERLEGEFGPAYAQALAVLRGERARLLREEPDPERRRLALQALVASLELP